MARSSSKTILLMGNVGTGKSTLMSILCEKLPATAVPADELFKVNPFFQLAVQDRKRWSFTSDMWFLHERVRMMEELQTQQQNSPTHLVIDSGIYMSYVYAHSRVAAGFMTDDEWQLYQKYFDKLTSQISQPDLIIFLTASTDALMKRIAIRGREFEVKSFTKEYLDGLQTSLSFVTAELEKKDLAVCKINSEKINFYDNQSYLNEISKKLEEK